MPALPGATEATRPPASRRPERRSGALAVLTIRKYPDPVLLSPCDPVETFDEALRELAEAMVETMYSAHGIGLAGNQVGESRRILIIDVTGGEDPDGRIVAVNPEIVQESGSQTDEEGCLSLPGIVAVVRRPARVTVRYRSVEGEEQTSEAEGLLARAWCHEIDHLDGRTILDRVSSLKRSLLKKQIRKSVRAGDWEETG